MRVPNISTAGGLKGRAISKDVTEFKLSHTSEALWFTGKATGTSPANLCVTTRPNEANRMSSLRRVCVHDRVTRDYCKMCSKNCATIESSTANVDRLKAKALQRLNHS